MALRVGNFILDKRLGAGAYAVVHRAHHEALQLEVAVKIIPKYHFCDPETRTPLMRELALMRQIRHPFISRLFQSCEDDDNFYLIQELADGGSLLDFIQQHERLPEAVARRYFSQLLLAVEYLHFEQMIVHRDIKCENILLDKHGSSIRLIDFGLSRLFSDFDEEFQSACGSPAYVSPELIRQKRYTRSADIWSMGVVLYAMVAGKLPFWDENPQRLLDQILRGEVEYPLYLSQILIDLLHRILCPNREARADIAAIKEHPWITGGSYISHLVAGLERLGDVRKQIDADAAALMRARGIDAATGLRAMVTGEESEEIALHAICLREAEAERMRKIEEAAEAKAAREKPAPFETPIGRALFRRRSNDEETKKGGTRVQLTPPRSGVRSARRYSGDQPLFSRHTT
jgi:serine/threonine protein kinase